MAERMRCPKCGAGMNHHADKLVHPVDREEAEQVDPALGGVVQQTHACPACGNVEFRLAPPPC
jgi:ribosomal protein S27AE